MMTDKLNNYSNLNGFTIDYKAEVSISKPDVKEKNKKYTVYKVSVNYGSQSWFVLRRYNEFSKLNDGIKKHYPNCSLKFPGKKLFGNNFDANFLKSRKDGLNEFVKKVTENQKYMQLPEVYEFLQIDRNKSCSSEGSNDISEDSNNGCDAGEDASRKLEEPLDIGSAERDHISPTDFDFLKVVGKGSFGKVFLAKHKAENRVYAVKVLQKKMIIRRNETKHIMSERNVLLKNLNHPFLVGLHYGFQTKEKLYFVLDYVNGGELFFHLQRERSFPESRARFYAAEIGLALGYLHSEGIVYRDLKPENILLDSTGHTVLTDFGLCKEGLLYQETTSTFCGTPEYLAPEVIKKEPYDKSVDWWCFGAVMYEMMYGLPPFYHRDTTEMYNNILVKPPKLRAIISAAARDLLSKLLHKDRTQRLGSSANDFQDVKNHEFFQSVTWSDVLAKKICPPYNPNLSGALDLKHIDPEFTKEPIPASVGVQALSVSASVKEADDVFQGFSYAPPLDYD